MFSTEKTDWIFHVRSEWHTVNKFNLAAIAFSVLKVLNIKH